MKAFFVVWLTPTLLLAGPKPPELRLPGDVAPQSYVLDLTLDPAKEAYSGRIAIALDVKSPTTLVWLNATRMIQVSKAAFTQNGKAIDAQIVNGDDDFVGLEPAQPLAPGAASVALEFSGQVNAKQSVGIFSSKEKDHGYLYTQFEPTGARAAFPCFDEPGYKTPWRLTLRVPPGNVAVSNTPVKSQGLERGLETFVFEETLPLPSYLVAFGVGPFEFVDAGRAGRKHVPVRIVVPRGDGARAQYAASVTAEILSKLEDYFGIPYPYAKADQVSIPLLLGAMENPGFVTYDARLILAPEKGDDPEQRKRGYFSVAAHELAHQWFGDLVTMAWWNDTWLNESFAEWMSSKLVRQLRPKWNTRVDDENSRVNAMFLDRLASARRIDQPVESKGDIGSAFDGITYLKGSAVLDMFEHAMGPEPFRSAVRQYLSGHALGNATADDFLNALGETGGRTIPKSFRTFLQQPGAPMVAMKLDCSSKPRLELRQSRFVPVGSTSPAQSWTIPVCVAYGSGELRKTACAPLEAATGAMALKTDACPAWFLGNADGAGYYYTSYDSAALNSLFDHRDQLTLAEQAGLFGELNIMIKMGNLPAGDALRLAQKLKDARRRQVVEAAMQFASIRLDYLPPKLRPKYQAYMRELFGERAHKLGWLPRPGESEDDALLRPELVPMVGGADDPLLVESAKTLTAKWLDSREGLPNTILSNVLAVAARNSGPELYQKILVQTKTEKNQQYREALRNTLGRFRQPELIERNFGFLMDGTFDWRESGFVLVIAPTNEPETAALPYAFVKANYDTIQKSLPAVGAFDFASYLPETAAMGCSEEEARDVDAFFRKRLEKVLGGPRELQQTIERIRLCAARKQVQQPQLIEFFSER